MQNIVVNNNSVIEKFMIMFPFPFEQKYAAFNWLEL